MAGESYSAGGIAVTTGATRDTGDFDLTRLAMGRVAEAVSQGTTYLETKTGYGLDVENEARSARIASTVVDEVTYLGAHLVPAGHGRRGVHGPGLRAHARRRPPLRPLGRRLLRTGRLHRGTVPPRAAGLQGRRTGAAGPRQPARRRSRRAARRGVRRRQRGPRELPFRRRRRRPRRQLVRMGRRRRHRHPRNRGHLPAGLRPLHPPAAGAGPGTARRRGAAGPGLQLQPGDVLHELHGILRHHSCAADAPERPRGRACRDVRRRPRARPGVRERRRRRTRGRVRSPSGTARTCTSSTRPPPRTWPTGRASRSPTPSGGQASAPADRNPVAVPRRAGTCDLHRCISLEVWQLPNHPSANATGRRRGPRSTRPRPPLPWRAGWPRPPSR